MPEHLISQSCQRKERQEIYPTIDCKEKKLAFNPPFTSIL